VQKKAPLLPKKARKEAKAEKKATKKRDKRSRGRDNEYVITNVPEPRRLEIWEEVIKTKQLVSRSDEPMPMSDCWSYGSRKGYSYYSLGHGKSQLKLTQLAIWMRDRKIPDPKLVIAHRCHYKPCFNPEHLYVTDTKTNSWCNGCPAYAIVDSKVYRVCAHGENWCMRRDSNCSSDYEAVFVRRL
jgi:hypothetical protein